MASPFRIQLLTNDLEGRTLIRLSGMINEDAQLDEARTVSSHSVEIDMSEVTGINSVGIRQFREWSVSLANYPSARVSFCPRAIIMQVNMVKGFLPPRTRIVSFYVPYYCPETGFEKSVLYSEGVEFRSRNGALELRHPEVKGANGERMQLDVLEEKYFAFLRSHG